MLKLTASMIEILVLTLFPACLFSANISVPEDALSLKDAMNLANDGDTILLNVEKIPYVNTQPVFPEGGIRVENKNIHIKGSIPGIRTEIISENIFLAGGLQTINIDSSNPANLLVVIESNVTIENVELNQPIKATISQRGIISSPIQVVSGTLHLNNVHFTGNIIVYSNLNVTNSILEGWAFLQSERGKNDKSTEIAAIDIRNCSGGLIELNNVVLDSNENEKGYKAITISDSKQCTINIEDSNVQAGSSFGEDRLYPNINRKAHGIEIRNCQEIELNLRNSIIIGGTELGAEYMSTETIVCEDFCQTITDIHRRYQSGSGIRMNDSLVEINGGVVRGGIGADGVYSPGVRGLVPNMLYQAGDGGHALELIHSQVKLNETLLLGSAGGIPTSDSISDPGAPGKNGQNILVDDYSVILNQSSIKKWELYH